MFRANFSDCQDYLRVIGNRIGSSYMRLVLVRIWFVEGNR